MSLRYYSNLIKKTRRGTNAMSLDEVLKIAYEYAEKLKNRPDSWPVLDVGCGEGYLAQECAKNGIPYVGIDLDPRQLRSGVERMKGYNLQANLLQCDACRLPFKDNYFGHIVSDGMLMMMPFVRKYAEERILSEQETVEEVKKAMLEMKRVARNDGTIRIIICSDRYEGEPEYYKPKPRKLEKLGKEIGLHSLDVDYMNGNAMFVEAVFRK